MKASVLALALLWAGPLFAQTPPAAGAPPGSQRLDNLAILLDLTDAQKTQVQSILEEEHAKAKAAFEQARTSGTKPDPEQMHTLHQQIHQDTIQKLSGVLTPEQMKKFEILSEQHHGWHRGFRGAPQSNSSPPTQN